MEKGRDFWKGARDDVSQKGFMRNAWLQKGKKVFTTSTVKENTQVWRWVRLEPDDAAQRY